MQNLFSLLISVGFLLFAVGALSRAYMVFTVNGSRALYTFHSGRTPRREYELLVTEHRAPAWPLFMSRKGLLLGAGVCAGAVILMYLLPTR